MSAAHLRRNWRLGLIALLLVGYGFDNAGVPYFNERVWTFAYLFAAFNFLCYWWFYTRQWLLRSSVVLCSISTVRAISFIIGGRLGGTCNALLIVVMTWIIYGLRVPGIPRDGDGA